MRKKQKILNIIEDDENYSNYKRKRKDSDEEYNIDEDDDIYSDLDDEEDASYIIKKNIKREFGK